MAGERRRDGDDVVVPVEVGAGERVQNREIEERCKYLHILRIAIAIPGGAGSGEFECPIIERFTWVGKYPRWFAKEC